MALLKAAKVLDGLKLEGDQKVGADIVRRAVEAPMRWIATNAGVEGLPGSRAKPAVGAPS